MQSFSNGVDLDRFLDDLRIPHELDLALSRPDENYQRLRSCNEQEEQYRQYNPQQQQIRGPPPPKKSGHPSRHHQELLRRLNSSRDFGSHKQDLSIVKLPRPDDGGGGSNDKMLNEYMERIQQLEDKKRRAVQQGGAAASTAERNVRTVNRSASTDNVLADEFMVARQRFNLADVDEAESVRDATENGGRPHPAKQNGHGSGGQFPPGDRHHKRINSDKQMDTKYRA